MRHEESLAAAATARWTGGSGSLYSYSNTNYSALALLVEKLRGKDIGAVIRADNVEPLGLQDTLMTGDEPGPQRMVHGYTRIRKRRGGGQPLSSVPQRFPRRWDDFHRP